LLLGGVVAGSGVGVMHYIGKFRRPNHDMAVYCTTYIPYIYCMCTAHDTTLICTAHDTTTLTIYKYCVSYVFTLLLLLHAGCLTLCLCLCLL
jgi:hypothetical protein